MKRVSLLSLAVVLVALPVGADVVDDHLDAIIVEASPEQPQSQHPSGDRHAKQLPSSDLQTPVLPDGSRPPLYQACVTKQGKYGRCMTLNECYPQRKIFRFSPSDSWVMGLLNTCSHNTDKGRQVFGVCCTQGFPQTTPQKSAEEDGGDEEVEGVNLRDRECLLTDKERQEVSRSSCRMSRKQNFLKIVGGYVPSANSYKFVVAMLTTKNGSPRQFCGGSLIDACHVLTAAHCVDRYSKYDVAHLLIYLGDHNINDNDPLRSVHKVNRLIKHKRFNEDTLHNDIAILTLSNCVDLNAKSTSIQPICLPEQDESFVNEQVIVAGWGSLSAGGSQPDELRAVDVKVWSNSDCASSYGGNAPGGIIDTMMCASAPSKDSCSGDSGGALFFCNRPDNCMQVGIVSWGIGCANAKYPGVYTRVTRMKEWIEKIQNCY